MLRRGGCVASGPWRLCRVTECDPGYPILQGRVLLSLQRDEWRDWHLFQQEKKKTGNEFPHVLPGCLMNEMWDDVRMERRGARKVALNILNDPFVHPSTIRMDCEWCGQCSDDSGEIQALRRIFVSLPPPNLPTLSLSWVRLWALFCQIQIPNIAHLSFTFKRNGIIAFITVRSKSEIREKANRQWLMPEAFPWFAD